MFGLFNKKQKATIGDHISYIIDSKTNFQLDILRQGDIDFQIFRQRLLKHLGTSVDNPNGIAFLISFNLKNIDSVSHYENFKSSPLYKECEKVALFENSSNDVSFVIKTDSNKNQILSLIKAIQTKVFNYDEKTSYLFSFKEI